MKRSEVKVILSETRIAILKALKERRKTVSELSKELDLSKSTVHEHLIKLVKTGFVKRVNRPGRKWVYYQLTEKAESLFGVSSKKIVVTFCLTIISFFSGAYQIYQSFFIVPAVKTVAERGAKIGINYPHLIVGLVLIGVSFVLTVRLSKLVRKNRTFSLRV
ncbi:MAG: winged helix-turn-helix transcriptional regulator [Candidatus Aenigmarchaeota archaeon]|nr:winged helix-turn-helix transcriptional regulator [Candidatus Aenigmarchaeota archaeon]